MRVHWIHCLAALVPVFAADEGNLQARQSQPQAAAIKVAIAVANTRGDAAQLFWSHLSNGASEMFLHRIEARASVQVEAFEGYELYARSTDGKLLGLFRVGPEKSQSFNIRDPLPRLRDGSGLYHPDATTVRVTFLNDREELARVFWRNPHTGEELLMGQIESKLFFDLTTWQNTQLVARDGHGKQIGELFVVGAAKRQQFVLPGDTGEEEEEEEVAQVPILEEDAQFDEF